MTRWQPSSCANGRAPRATRIEPHCPTRGRPPQPRASGRRHVLVSCDGSTNQSRCNLCRKWVHSVAGGFSPSAGASVTTRSSFSRACKYRGVGRVHLGGKVGGKERATMQHAHMQFDIADATADDIESCRRGLRPRRLYACAETERLACTSRVFLCAVGSMHEEEASGCSPCLVCCCSCSSC